VRAGAAQDAQNWWQRNKVEEGGGGYLGYGWDSAIWGVNVQLAYLTNNSAPLWAAEARRARPGPARPPLSLGDSAQPAARRQQAAETAPALAGPAHAARPAPGGKRADERTRDGVLAWVVKHAPCHSCLSAGPMQSTSLSLDV